MTEAPAGHLDAERDPEDFRDADDREQWLKDNVPPHHG